MRGKLPEAGNRGGPASVCDAMTILDTLPALRAHGALQVSDAPLDHLGPYRRLLLDAPTAGRCPVLLTEHALGSVPRDHDPARAVGDTARRSAGPVLAERYPTGCVHHPRCL